MNERIVNQLPYPIKVWKVVRQDEKHNFHSVCKAENVDITYVPKKEVIPSVENTPIFTFRTLNAAFSFKSQEHFILECLCDKTFAFDLARVLPTGAIATISPERLYDFWCIDLERKKFGAYSTVYKAQNTVLACSVTPIRVLTNKTVLKELYG